MIATPKKYSLPKEHALALADDNSPVYAIGSFQTLKSLFKDEEKILKAFKTGRGLKWGDHDANLFEGTDSRECDHMGGMI